MTASASPELLQAHVELWNLSLSYLKSMALQCTVELGIPNAIHCHGGSASLSDLLDTLPVPEHKRPFLPRFMRFLAATGILALDAPTAAGGDRTYSLNPLSRLLVDDDLRINGRTSLAPLVLTATTKYLITAAMHLSEWFKGDYGSAAAASSTVAAEMPFVAAHGVDFWEATRRDPQFNETFNAGMASNSQLALDFVVRECKEVFYGISSLIDVGGGNGSAARAIARAFPHITCSVLDLPNVISGIPQPADGNNNVQYIAGDMMDSIPPTDAVLLKSVLHDWNDEECVKILKQCKKAIRSGKSSKGKVIIIDTIIGSSPSKDVLESHVSLDLLMMVLTSGKERDEQEWSNVFMQAGFKHHKTSPVLGLLSIIELYPEELES